MCGTEDDALGHDAIRTKCHKAMSSLRAKELHREITELSRVIGRLLG